MFLGLAGCGGGKPAPRRLTVLAQGDVDSLDPGVTNYQFGYMIEQAMQRTLFAYRPGHRSAVPDLATGPARISDGGRTVTVEIRRGVRYSPPVGREVVAADIKYAFERSFLPSVGNGYATTYFGDLVGAAAYTSGKRPEIAGIETPTRNRLAFRFTRPVGAVAAKAMALPISAPVPPEYARPLDRAARSRYGLEPVSTGPYMLERKAGHVTGYRPGQRIVLVRNPNWSEANDYRRPQLREIEVREGFDPDLASRRILSGRGMVSGDFLVPPQVIARHLHDPRLLLAPSGGVAYVALNTRIAPFDRLAVRRAVAAILNRNQMRKTFGGPAMGRIATHFIPAGMPGFAQAGGTAGPPLDFLRRAGGNATLAARYMRRAGFRTGRWSGGAPLAIVASNDPATVRLAEVVQSELAPLGLRSRLRVLSTQSETKFCGALPTDAAVCADAGWLAEFDDPQTMLDAPFNGRSISPVGNPNLSQFDDARVNDAIDRASVLVDPQRRAAAWAAIDRMVTAEVPAVPWLWSNTIDLRSGDVRAAINPATARWDLVSAQVR